MSAGTTAILTEIAMRPSLTAKLEHDVNAPVYSLKWIGIIIMYCL